MGTFGRPGASLRGWTILFPKATIFGADIDRNILFTDARIKTYYCDQTSDDAIKELWQQADLREGADIIIEDGLHTFEANKCFLENSLRYLRSGGIYIIEDITKDDISAWRRTLTCYRLRFKGYHFALVEVPNGRKSFDNNLLLVQRDRFSDLAWGSTSSDKQANDLNSQELARLQAGGAPAAAPMLMGR
jgi:hypothetical protein